MTAARSWRPGSGRGSRLRAAGRRGGRDVLVCVPKEKFRKEVVVVWPAVSPLRSPGRREAYASVQDFVSSSLRIPEVSVRFFFFFTGVGCDSRVYMNVSKRRPPRREEPAGFSKQDGGGAAQGLERRAGSGFPSAPAPPAGPLDPRTSPPPPVPKDVRFQNSY